MSISLGRYFTLSELCVTSQRLPNVPSDAHVANLHDLVRMQLDPLRTRIGRALHVSSGYRSPDVNAAVHGSATSAHLDGRAADVWAAGLTSLELAKYATLEGQFDKIIAYHPSRGGHVHFGISRRDVRPREQLLVAPAMGGYVPWDGVSVPW